MTGQIVGPRPKKRGPKPRKPMKRMSDHRRAELPERARVREETFERDGGLCWLDPRSPNYPREAKYLSIPPCRGGPTFQHLKKASALGEFTTDNGATLCWYHNAIWVEDHPIEAENLGLVVR